MSWERVQPGLYRRPLGLGEKTMVAAITGARPTPREPVRIHCFVDFTSIHTSEIVAEAFKDAWMALRLLNSPDIATTFEGDTKEYKVAAANDLADWLSETFIVEKPGATIERVITLMQTELVWLPRCYLLPQSSSDDHFKGTLVLFISHWRTEASGALQMINQLFDYACELISGTATREALARYSQGSEASLLTPTMEEIMMPDQETTNEARARVKARFAEYVQKLPSVGFAIRGDASAASSYQTAIQRTYTASSTSALVVHSRMRGLTVTSAIHSAYINVIWQLAEDHTRDRPYTCMMPAQVRKRLPSTSPYHDQGCWNAAQMLLLSVPPGQDFETRGQSLRQQYELSNDEKWMHEDMRETSEQTIQSFAFMPKEHIATAWLTSMGVLDRDLLSPQHDGMSIQKVAMWADPVGPGIVLTLWTFRGKLNVQISWNAAYHRHDQVREVMDGIDRTLAQELDCAMSIDEERTFDFSKSE